MKDFFSKCAVGSVEKRDWNIRSINKSRNGLPETRQTNRF